MTGLVAENEGHASHFTRYGRNPRLSHRHPHCPKSSQHKHHLGHRDGRGQPIKSTASAENSNSRNGCSCKWVPEDYTPKHRCATGAVAAFAKNCLQRGNSSSNILDNFIKL